MDTNSNSQLIKKIMKKLTIIFTIILSVFSKNVMAQGEHPSNKQSEHPSNKTASNTIVDVAVSNKDFSTLVAALKAADLVSALQGAGPFTVFAPTNDAFAKIDAETLASLLEKKNQKVLANILTYHVISGKLAAADVVAALEKGKGSVVLTALNGEAITVMQKDGKIWLKDSNDNYSEITATDVMADNGVIHVINTVVMPKND
ncbi:fasciclin domain-containing protein [Cyclobacteriaceae bacterium]|nr:fasciclin domain-containing protein [Cyclobacteriaceae bacterium]